MILQARLAKPSAWHIRFIASDRTDPCTRAYTKTLSMYPAAPVRAALSGLRLVEAICSGHSEGGAVRSTAINFTPGRTAAGTYTADTHTAGSCTLMVQQALPCLLFAQQPRER